MKILLAIFLSISLCAENCDKPVCPQPLNPETTRQHKIQEQLHIRAYVGCGIFQPNTVVWFFIPLLDDNPYGILGLRAFKKRFFLDMSIQYPFCGIFADKINYSSYVCLRQNKLNPFYGGIGFCSHRVKIWSFNEKIAEDFSVDYLPLLTFGKYITPHCAFQLKFFPFNMYFPLPGIELIYQF